MKRVISILLMVVMLSAALVINASAEATVIKGFYNIEAKTNVTTTPYIGDTPVSATTKDVDGDGTEDTWYENSERFVVTYNAATVGAYYGVIMVEGSGLPTKDDAIFYIDQVEATTTTISFNIFPSEITETKEMTLYISSNDEAFDLLPISVSYVCAEETVTPPASGQTVSGTAISFMGAHKDTSTPETDEMLIELIPSGASSAAYSTKVVVNSKIGVAYSIENVAAGTYTVRVSKPNHVTREYTITVANAAVAQDVKIHVKGDFNGDGNITTVDPSRANAHVQGKNLVTDPYQFDCLNVQGATKDLTTADVMRINAHVKMTNKMW